MSISGIYKITNKTNNKIYIGSSNNITYRWGQHIDNLMLKTHHNLAMQNDFNKCTLNDFTFEILEIVENKYDRLEKEGEYIIKLKAYDNNIGYNKIINNNSLIKDNEELADEFIKNTIKSIDITSLQLIKNNMIIHDISINKSGLKKAESFKDNSFSKSWFSSDKNNRLISNSLLSNYFKHTIKSKNKSMYWTTYEQFEKELSNKGYTKGFLKLNCKKQLERRSILAFACNLYLNTNIFYDVTKLIDSEEYAYNLFLNWIVNVADINKPFTVYIPSIRMVKIIKEKLYSL